MTQQSVRELFIREEKARKQIISPFLAALGLTPGQGQARILYKLSEQDRITQKELADKCGLEAATMSRNIDRLAEMGFLIRENNPGCRRSFLICLTEEGSREVEQIKTAFQRFEELACEGIEKDDLAVFQRVIQKVCENLEACKSLGE